jgi:hypothetical protein
VATHFAASKLIRVNPYDPWPAFLYLFVSIRVFSCNFVATHFAASKLIHVNLCDPWLTPQAYKKKPRREAGHKV